MKVCRENTNSNIIIDIHLPRVETASHVDLDVTAKHVSLNSEVGEYKLDINLPYTVDDDQGTAKFDKDQHVLTINLPVIASADPESSPAASLVSA